MLTIWERLYFTQGLLLFLCIPTLILFLALATEAKKKKPEEKETPEFKRYLEIVDNTLTVATTVSFGCIAGLFITTFCYIWMK